MIEKNNIMIEKKVKEEVNEVLEEEREREMRKNNVIIFNVEEGNDDKEDEKSMKDSFLLVCELTGNNADPNTDLPNLKRLGKKLVSGRPRPIKASGLNAKLKRKLVTNSCQISHKATSDSTKKIVVVPDKTLKQRETDKALYLENKRRLDQGESDEIIRGKVVVVDEKGVEVRDTKAVTAPKN